MDKVAVNAFQDEIMTRYGFKYTDRFLQLEYELKTGENCPLFMRYGQYNLIDFRGNPAIMTNPFSNKIQVLVKATDN